MEGYAKPVEIIILSDGKKGHLNQSLAVAAMTKRSDSRVIAVNYRHKIFRTLVALLIHLPLSKAYYRFWGSS